MIRTAANSPAAFRQRLAETRLKLPRFNYFSRYIFAIERQERPLAKLSGRTAIAGDTYTVSADWPCNHFAGITRLLKDPLEGPVEALDNFFHEVGIADHILEGRHMKKELEARFRFSLPYDLIALATEAGRGGILRPFGYRLAPGTVTSQDIRYAHRLLEIAGEVYGELADAFATHAIAWPCVCCRRLILDLEPAYCSAACEQSQERRESYTDGGARKEKKVGGSNGGRGRTRTLTKSEG
jgi:hypothetical protein